MNIKHSPINKSGYVIISGFVGVLLVFCIVLVIWSSTTRQEYQRLIVIDQYRQAAEYLGDMRKAALHRSVLLHEMTLVTDAFDLDEKHQEFSNEAGDFMVAREKYRSLTLLKDSKELWDRINAKANQNALGQRDAVQLIQDGEIYKARQVLYEKLMPEQRSVLLQLSQMLDQQHRLVSDELELADKAKQHNVFLIAVLAAFVFIVTIIIIIFVVRTTIYIQNDLRKADEARVASKMKSRFISSMSHELRTPLNAILGFGQLLEMQYGTLTEKEAQQYINDILQAGYHLLDLINEVLDLSRIESGHLDIKLEPVPIKELVKACIAQIDTSLARKNNITIIDQIGENDIMVLADLMRLRQVFINLLSNAVKYNRDGGSVYVTTEMTGNRQLRIMVSDNGKGIAAADIGKLFDPFERLTFKHSNVEGTGIGLTVTQQLVNAMGGTIGVTSIVDQGSSFWLDLPLVSSADVIQPA